METLGAKLRKLREQRELPLRTVAAFLDVDQAILSKIERDQRKATRQLVLKLAKYYKVPKDDLLISWLSDKIVYELADEENALKALQVAEESVAYKTKRIQTQTELIREIRKVLVKDDRVISAWLFGSAARGKPKEESDVDIMVELGTGKSYSFFDLIDIAHQIEVKIKKRVDIVEKGSLKKFALQSAQRDMIKIYG